VLNSRANGVKKKTSSKWPIFLRIGEWRQGYERLNSLLSNLIENRSQDPRRNGSKKDPPSTSKTIYDLTIETNNLVRIPRGHIKQDTN
jgi:hypothetical protein